ncbi:MAG: AraC family transcriptional regulator [Pseudomonadota bacterium]|nr:AraC family transcriptional regulator [Pseudomonadota bacterium]
MPSKPDDPILLYLWTQRTLYLGELPPVPDLTPAATTLLIGLEKPFRIHDYASGQTTLTRSALIPAGTHFGAYPQEQTMVNCYLDPMGHDLAFLMPQMQNKLGDILLDSRTEADQIRLFKSIFMEELVPEDAYGVLLHTVFASKEQTFESNAQQAAQKKVSKLIQLIRDDPLANLPAHWLAQQVDLSPSQMNRWFKRFTGVPLRRYRLWHRLFVTANLMAQGNSLTEAAHAAGFTDSSHLNHTFRSMLGMTPSFVFQRSERLRIFGGGNQ